MRGGATKPTSFPGDTQTPSSSSSGSGDAGDFECNICLDLAQDPIITLCGHLFCWPCLYRWLRLHSQSHECPVCKALIQEEKLIPLYGRGKKDSDPRSKPVPGVEIPNRPSGERPPTAPPPPPPPPPPYEANGFSNIGLNFVGGILPVVTAGIGNFAMLAAFGGLLPSMLSIRINGSPMHHRVNSGYGYGHFGGQQRGDNNNHRAPGIRRELDTEDNKLISMFFIVLGLVVLSFLV